MPHVCLPPRLAGLGGVGHPPDPQAIDGGAPDTVLFASSIDGGAPDTATFFNDIDGGTL